MNTKLITLVATGFAGLTLGLGVGVAAAQPDTDDSPTTTPADVGSMDEMHAAMRDQMPPELAARCDEMHASMPADMAAMDPGQMMGGMGQMMGGAGVMDESMPAGHAAHHDGNG